MRLHHDPPPPYRLNRQPLYAETSCFKFVKVFNREKPINFDFFVVLDLNHPLIHPSSVIQVHRKMDYTIFRNFD